MKDERILHAVVIVLVLLTFCAWVGAWDANRRYRAWESEWQDYDLVVGTVITGTLGLGHGNYDGITIDDPDFEIAWVELPPSFAITVTYTITEFEAIGLEAGK